MSNFDWYTEEDVNWEEEPPQPPPPPRRSGGWTRWVLLLAIVLVGAGTVAGLVYRRLSHRVEEVSYVVEADVRDSHGIVYQSALDGDRDLFITFLSGYDPDWASAQERVIAAGLFYERPGFGLGWLPEDAETAVSAVDINPTLTAAVLTSTHAYAVGVGNGLSQTITLERTAVYRLGPDRWLFSPPRSEYWGETASSQGTLLTLTYPERDREISQRLAADLEAKIQEVCTRFPELECPADMHVTVEFSPDPAAVYESNQLPKNVTITVPRMRSLGWYSFPARLGEQTLTLPTPSLLGMPVDEAGYQAIYRGYAARIVSAVVAERVGWACCDRATLFQVLLDVQLDQLGLKRWPVQAQDYEAFLGVNLTTIYDEWRGIEFSESEDTLPLYVLVDFLLRDAEASSVTLQRLLTSASIPADEWLNTALANAYPTLADAERGWMGFLYERSRAYQAAPPLPVPAQPVYLVCRPNEAETAYLYRHDLGTGEFEVARALGEATAVLLPLPNQEKVLVGETGTGFERTGNTFIWGEDGETAVSRSVAGGAQNALPVAASPDGRLAVLSVPGEIVVPYALLDVAGCTDGAACAATSLLGFPVWSPDGQHTLLRRDTPANDGDTLIFWGDSTGENVNLLGEGRLPFWLDNERMGYVDPDSALLTETLGGNDPQPVLTLADLLPSVPGSETTPAGHYYISYAGFSAPYGKLLLIVSDIAGIHHVLEYSPAQGEPVLYSSWKTSPGTDTFEALLSANGRWLTLLAFSDVDNVWALYLIDVETGTTQYYPLGFKQPPSLIQLVDWSADGNWLALTYDGYVRFMAPVVEYERWFIPDRTACDQAVWGHK